LRFVSHFRLHPFGCCAASTLGFAAARFQRLAF
jgi:hypothetical protein